MSILNISEDDPFYKLWNRNNLNLTEDEAAQVNRNYMEAVREVMPMLISRPPDLKQHIGN